jgi:hypothetical protein
MLVKLFLKANQALQPFPNLRQQRPGLLASVVLLKPVLNTLILYLSVVLGVTKAPSGVWHYIRRGVCLSQDWLGG